MSNSYRSKLIDSISNLPQPMQTDYQSALEKHKFDLELYVPKNNPVTSPISLNSIVSKKIFKMKAKEKAKTNYLRDKLIDFDSKLHKDKEYVHQLQQEVKTFSKDYSRSHSDAKNIEKSNSKINTNKSELLKLYNDSIKTYRERDYNENKLFPKNNIFEPSMLLKRDKDLDMIIENIDSKQIKKEKHLVKTLNSDTLRLIKGNAFKSKYNIKKKKNRGNEDLPIIPMNYKSIRKENKRLQKEILLTETTLYENNKKNIDNIGFNSTDTNYTVLNIKNNKEKEISESTTRKSWNNNLDTINNNTLTIDSNTDNKLNDNANTDTNLTKPTDNQGNEGVKNLGMTKKRISLSQSSQLGELNKLYSSFKSDSYKCNVENAKSYISKYKKQIIESVK